MDKKGISKILIGLMIFFLLLFIASYLYFTGGKGAYKLGQTRGVSKNIQESKERNVYLFEVDYYISPDSIKFIIAPDFFLEKGFNYGEWKASDTEPLLNESKPYQISFNSLENLFNYDFFIEDYYEKDTWRLSTLHLDTIKFNLMSKSPPYDSIYKVGELKLFKKK